MGDRSGGWQVNVEYFDNYVVKTPKTVEEIRATVSKYLNHIGKLDELENRVSYMQRDWEIGLEIVKRGHIPNSMFGYLEFLDGGKIKQRRVNVLQDVWEDMYNSGKQDAAREIVDKSLDFIVELWKYGVHEKTFKVGYEYGLMDGDIMLIDFGELCEDRNVVIKEINEKKWVGQMAKYSNSGILDYFNEQADKKLTLKVLEENWGKYNR